MKITSKPLSFYKSMNELWQGREIGIILIKKELSIQFKQTMIGVLWFLLRPIVTVTIFATIFRYIVRFPAGDTPYAVFVMCGIVPWMYFLEAFSKGMESLNSNSDIVTRIYFPRMLLPLSAITAPLADMTIGVLTLVVVMLFYDLTPPPQIVFMPFFILLIYLFAFAMSLCTAGPQAVFRDIGIVFKFVLPIWMYMTPIIYPLNILPPFLQKILSCNPLTGIVTALRWSVIGYGTFPTYAIVVSVITTALLLMIGMHIFRRWETHYIDQV